MWVIWVDVAAVVLGLAALTLVALNLYRRIKHATGTIKDANGRISELTAALEQAQASKRT